MSIDFAQQAVSAALSADWDEAVRLNKLLLKKDKQNVDALNRLAKAYSELGDIERAKRIAKRVLRIDKYNKIATKHLLKWKGLKKVETKTHKPSSVEMFLEEAGKTKILNLLNLGGKQKVVAKLNTGDEVKIVIRGHRVCVTTLNDLYVGRLPDDLADKLKKLIKYGNVYKAYVKSVKPDEVRVFIREIKRAKALEDIPSFSTDKIEYISFTPPELVHDKSEISKSLNSNEEEE